ncbi:MAG: ATP-dependent DNA ligase [Chloroflexota bacterium]|nr:ATP-dependent DNA ligase [Chloroflexota bacterium]
MSARFSDWVNTADAVRSTTKKLVKMNALARYLAGLDEADLPAATRLFAGRPFARADERVLSLGWSALVEAVLERARRSSEDLRASYQRHADLGDVAAELLDGAIRQGEPLELADIAAAFATIASAKGTAAKRALLREILARTDAAEARYVVKLMTGEPRIGLREGLLEDAVARAFGAEREAVGRAHMLSGDIGEVAVRARAGTLARAILVPFTPIGMMLATPVLQLEEVPKRFPPPYVVEDKYDGVRAQVHKSRERVELYSRTFDRVTDRFPELLDALRAMPGSFILDAEVLSLAGGRAIPFVRFQRRLGRKGVEPALQAELPATLVAFDILERDGRALLDAPLHERQALLRALPLEEPLIFARQRVLDLSGEELSSALDKEFAEARERGNEGLMVKDPRSPYRPGRRGMEWLKVKRALRALDVVVTAVEWGHGKRHGVLSDYTFAVRDGDRLLEVGKAYSGLTDAEIAERTQHFLAHTIADRGRLRLVEPDTVIEVAFDSVQRSARHPSGYALRFPRIVRLRPDKPVSEVDTLRTVREIAEAIG